MNDEERAAELLEEIFDSVLREKGDKLALAYLSDILQAVKEIRLIAVDVQAHVDAWEEARLSDYDIHAHGLTAQIAERLEADAGEFAKRRAETAQALHDGCIALEKTATDMIESCLALWPPL